MRKYWIYYYSTFANAYHLYYTDGEEQEKLLPKDAIHIGRKQAENYAREERKRRKNNLSFSYYADIYIYPIDYNPTLDNVFGDKYKTNGYMVESIQQEVL